MKHNTSRKPSKPLPDHWDPRKIKKIMIFRENPDNPGSPYIPYILLLFPNWGLPIPWAGLNLRTCLSDSKLRAARPGTRFQKTFGDAYCHVFASVIHEHALVKAEDKANSTVLGSRRPGWRGKPGWNSNLVAPTWIFQPGANLAAPTWHIFPGLVGV